MKKKIQWRKWENIACKRLVENHWNILETNFTIRWGEIDILAERKEVICCVEVKYVDVVDDITSYISKKKLFTLQRTFQTYLRRYPTKKQPRIDVIFVKHDRVWHVCENVTWT